MRHFDFGSGTAIVTGAASGIGEQLAHQLGRRGIALALVDRDGDRLDAVATAVRTTTTRVTTYVVDLADDTATHALGAQLAAAHPDTTLLINNAGVALGGRFEQLTEEEFDWLLAINFRAVVTLTRALLPVLQRNRGSHLVNVSSLFGLIAPAGQSAYATSKFAVRGFTEALRAELAGSVGVTVVHPGGIRTRIAETARIASAVPDIGNERQNFNKLLTFPADKAAKMIVNAVHQRKPRLLIGMSAVAPDILARLTPAHYTWALTAFGRLAKRRHRRSQKRPARAEPPAPGTAEWSADVLGESYQRQTIELGADPDGEGRIEAVLIRRRVADGERPTAAMLYVHGFTDYFFQTELADFAAARGFAFYAIDLRKCGRARRPGQTAHYVSDLGMYDAELERAVVIISGENPEAPVTVLAHSTGGLIAALWLDRRRRSGRVAPIAALVLNSPWLDLRGTPVMRGPVTWALRPAARFASRVTLPLPESTVYGNTLHTTGTGEWDYDLTLKPIVAFPVTVGWLNAIRRGHAQLHRGLDVGVPVLVLTSDKTLAAHVHDEINDHADLVLDVAQIARWTPALGADTTLVPIAGARHDVFLSLAGPRRQAYAALHDWLTRRRPVGISSAAL